MNEHAKAVISDVERQIKFHEEHIGELKNLRDRIALRFIDRDEILLQNEKVLPIAGCGQPAAESSQSAAPVRAGRFGRADRMVDLLLQIPGLFSLGVAMRFLSNRGLGATKSTVCLACARLVKQGRLKKIRFGLYCVKAGPPCDQPGRPRKPDPDDALPAQPQPPQGNVDPRSAQAVTLSATLPVSFTLLDVSVRSPKNQAGFWLADWKARGWVETVGPGQFRKTTLFGQHATK